MNQAIFKDTNVDLHHISASQLQIIFEQGKRDELSCPVCHQTVRLYMGIHETPHFFHKQQTSNCKGPTEEKITVPLTEDADDLELNGFRLPQSRTITKTKVETNPFPKAKIVSGNPPFQERHHLLPQSHSSYLEALQAIGVLLDSEQLQAATTVEGPLLVLSGAGSGKTRVLTVRTAYMLMEKQIDPKTIMLVTFTSKAAKEMQKRLQSYPKITASVTSQLVSGTFHSIFYKILLFHEPQKWRQNLLLKWDWEKEKILRQAGREIELDEKEFSYDQALGQIGLWKNSLLFPDDVEAADEWQKSCQFLYKKYEDYKAQNGYFDFDDMLVGCFLFLKNNPDILENYQQRFHYFLIDEFQDINRVQYELIKLLSHSHKNVCVVGDDDQAIYSFRGSDPTYILNFDHDFPGTKVITLSENYRSSHEIVATANRMIKRNQKRMNKTMHAQHNHGTAPVLFYPYDEEIEATMIVTDIQEKIENGARPGDFAILYRTHSMSRAIFERLATSNLPFVIERDAEAFYGRRVIRGMLAFLRLSLEPDHIKAASEVLSALFLKQGVLQELRAQTILQDCDLIDAFRYVKTGHAFQEKRLQAVPALIRGLKDLSPLVALEVIEKDLGYQDYVKKRGNDASIEKGSDDIRDLRVAAKKFQTVQAFIEHTDHMTSMVQEVKQWSKNVQDAIQLTTIHRAKGLEYQSVYILATVDGSLPHDFALDSYRQGDLAPLEEERRLLYVAATRAKQNLSISIPQTRRGKTAYPSRFLKF